VGYDWVPLLLANLRDIEPYEVRQVLEDERPRWPRAAVGAGMAFLTIWGKTRRGRQLVVVLRPTEVSRNWLIVGTKQMTAEEAAEYDRWEAHRDR